MLHCWYPTLHDRKITTFLHFMYLPCGIQLDRHDTHRSQKAADSMSAARLAWSACRFYSVVDKQIQWMLTPCRPKDLLLTTIHANKADSSRASRMFRRQPKGFLDVLKKRHQNKTEGHATRGVLEQSQKKRPPKNTGLFHPALLILPTCRVIKRTHAFTHKLHSVLLSPPRDDKNFSMVGHIARSDAK